MDMKYEQLGYFAGNTIEQAVNELLTYKKEGRLACGEFNGVTLYSDSVTMDSAYRAITGRTKAEFDKERQERNELRDRQKKEHEEKIPELITVWMAKGREILTEDKWEYWDKIVPIRLSDLYQGRELSACLDIVNILNNNGSLEEAKEEIESQGHSGTSFGLVCVMVKALSNRGTAFVEYVE